MTKRTKSRRRPRKSMKRSQVITPTSGWSWMKQVALYSQWWQNKLSSIWGQKGPWFESSFPVSLSDDDCVFHSYEDSTQWRMHTLLKLTWIHTRSVSWLSDKTKNKRKRADEQSVSKKGKGTRVEVEYENEDDDYERMKEVESQKATAAMDFNFWTHWLAASTAVNCIFLTYFFVHMFFVHMRSLVLHIFIIWMDITTEWSTVSKFFFFNSRVRQSVNSSSNLRKKKESM